MFFSISTANSIPSIVSIFYNTISSAFNDTIVLSPDSATQGTLTVDQLQLLQRNKYARIKLNNEIYELNDDEHTAGMLVYTHNGYEFEMGIHKYISITISTKGWVQINEKSSVPIIEGTYSEADGWIYFSEQPKIRQNGGTPYTIVLQSSQISNTTLTMPIHLFDMNNTAIFGATVTGKMGNNILNITPYMGRNSEATGWHLGVTAYIMNGEQAGTDIASQLIPTLTLIGLIELS